MATIANWEKLTRTPVRPGVDRRVVSGKNCMLVLNDLKPGSKPNVHKHPHEQLTYIAEGTCKFFLGDEVLNLGPGDVVTIPPEVPHGLEVTGSEAVINFDVFSPIREDFLA